MPNSNMFGWGNNPGYNSVMNNSQSIVPGMDWQSNMPAMGGNIPGPEQTGGGWSLMGGTDEDGFETQSGLGAGLGVANGLFKGWMGLKQLDMAKKQLGENKRQFNMNWGAQKKTTNNQLANAQRVRASANPNAQPVDEYMSKWGVK